MTRKFMGYRNDNQKLHMRAAELAAIAAYSSDLTAMLCLEEIITRIHKLLLSQVSPDLTVIHLKQENKLIIEKRKNDSIIHSSDAPKMNEVGECLSGIVMQTRKPVYSIDINADPYCFLAPCKRSGIRSFAALPLLFGDELLGLLGLASFSRRNFSDQAHFLETIAYLTAIYFHNLKLNEKIRRRVNHLAKVLKERNQANRTLHKHKEDFERNTKKLFEAKAALKVLLKQREQDKVELEQKVIENVSSLVLPYLEKLKKSTLSPRQKGYITVMESNLKEIVSPFAHNLSSGYINLTPKEIQVADLIRKGKTSKEIAVLFNSSTRVIDFHRNNIRTKFGLINKKINLRSHLLMLD